MQTIKKVKIGVGVVLLVVIALFFHHTLPRTEVVQITGTDVKRVDKTGKVIEDWNEKTAGSGKPVHTYDVRFINSLTRKGKALVFRNEDTGWGWPPYLKFNSADLTAEAQAFASDQNKPWVLVKYYGWRLKLFSMFPNALNMKAVDRDYTHIPVFNILFFAVLIFLVIFIRYKFGQLFDRIRGRKKSEADSRKA
jgi:hypothetical protein